MLWHLHLVGLYATIKVNVSVSLSFWNALLLERNSLLHIVLLALYFSKKDVTGNVLLSGWQCFCESPKSATALTWICIYDYVIYDDDDGKKDDDDGHGRDDGFV